MSTPKDVYKILQKAKISGFFVVKRNEMSRVGGQAMIKDLGLRSGALTWG